MHPNKPRKWLNGRYWGHFATNRQNATVFGDPRTGAFLPPMAWTRIERHVLVRGTASPDDPALTEYWAKRMRREDYVRTQVLPREKRLLSRMQGFVCPLCGERILNGEAIHVHHVHGRMAGDGLENKIVVHLPCHQQVHSLQKEPA